MALSGRVERTLLRGKLIYKGFSDKFECLEPSGALLDWQRGRCLGLNASVWEVEKGTSSEMTNL